VFRARLPNITRHIQPTLCGNAIMNIMGRHVLRLLAIGGLAIAIPQLASASDAGSSATFKLAMGPMSAAQKNQSSTAATSDTTGLTCPEGSCWKPRYRHHHSKLKHAYSK
jgi:hypothetical protein